MTSEREAMPPNVDRGDSDEGQGNHWFYLLAILLFGITFYIGYHLSI